MQIKYKIEEYKKNFEKTKDKYKDLIIEKIKNIV